jgi:hypothetical protein
VRHGHSRLQVQSGAAQRGVPDSSCAAQPWAPLATHQAGPRQTLPRWVRRPASSDGSRCLSRSPAAPRLLD